MQRLDRHATSRERPKSPEEFRDSVQSALKEVFGDSGSRAVIYHLGPVDYDDVEDFHVRLKAIFGTGTPSLERVIVDQLAILMDVPVSTLRPDDIVKSVSLARASTKQRKKR